MSHIALARKWRPQRFEDVIGQRGTVETLKNAIATGRLAQSFIFAGPRGVGKTTTARILARALNCVKGPTPEPCGECDACREIAVGRDVDVLEIDGATYTGVDAVREVIVEPLAMAPMRDRFKIFIIDEVHRLSKSAFDALLKSIEEPPPYVKFMMATTDLESVPATIQSRSQVFELKTLPFAAIRDQLKGIAAQEHVTIDDTALSLVARSAEGSMRDALSALDQVLAFTEGTVTSNDVGTVLGLIGRDIQFAIAETVAREDVGAAFELAGTVVESGVDLRIVCRELARLMRDLMVVKIDPSRLQDPEIASESERERIQALTGQYSREDLMRSFDLLSQTEFDIKSSSQPRHQFEMALVKWIHLRKLTPLSELIEGLTGTSGTQRPAPTAAPSPSTQRPAPIAQAAPIASAPRPMPSAPTASSAPRPAPSAQVAPSTQVASSTQHPAPSTDVKSRLLSSIREQNKVFYGMVIAQAVIDIEGDTIVFAFAPVHRSLQTQLESKRGWIEQLAHSVTGRKMSVVVKERAVTPPAGPQAADPEAERKAALHARAKAEPHVQAVLDVFGGQIEDVEEIK
jgi:DNA polymerase-3 subunit gamma/tau